MFFFPLAEVKTKFERLEKPFSSVGLSSKFKAALKGFLGSNFSKAMGCKGSAAITLIKGCEGPQRPNFWSAFKSWSAVGSDHLTKEIQKKGQTNNFSFFLENLFLFVFSSLWRVMTYSVGIYFFTVRGRKEAFLKMSCHQKWAWLNVTLNGERLVWNQS